MMRKNYFFFLLIGFAVCSCTFSSNKRSKESLERESSHDSPSIVDKLGRIIDEGDRIIDEGNRIIEEGNRIFNGEDEADLPVIVSDMNQMNSIAQAYSSNEIKAKQSYEGKRYQLTGKVIKIASDPHLAVVLEGTNNNDFWFYLLQSEENRASDLTVGEKVTLSGVLTGCIELLEGYALSFEKSRFESVSSTGQMFPKDEIVDAIKSWNVLHNTYNSDMVVGVYAPKVLYYWSDYSADKVKESKASLFSKNPQFQQSLSNIRLQYVKADRIRAVFTKSVKVNPSEPAKDYESYIVFEKVSGAWRVVEESDMTTDKNMMKRMVGGMQKMDENGILSLYGKEGKNGTSFYLFNDQTKKRFFLFTTGDNNGGATDIKLLNSDGRITISSVSSIRIISEDSILITTDDLPYAGVYIYNLEKKGCISLPDAYGDTNVVIYNGGPAIMIPRSYVSENGRFVYEAYYDLKGKELGKGQPVSLE